MRYQLPRRDVIEELGSMVAELMKIFYHENGQTPPKRILFYRDGCGENQAHEVAIAELKAIREACQVIHPDYCPTVTYVVVQKRHHVRVFAQDVSIW